MTLDQYRQAFRREVYALMRDAYEESFTPGSDHVKTPKRPITMKPDLYRQLAFMAVQKLARGGVKAPSGFSIAKEQGEVFAQGGYAKNPSTPRVFAEMYDTSPFFAQFFGVRKNPSPVSPEQNLFQQFKSSVQLAVTLYFVRKGFANESFEYPKGKLSDDQLKTVELNRYRKYVMSGVVLAVLKLAYEITPQQIDEILSLMGVKAMSWKQLDQKQTRLAFGQAFNQLMEKTMGNPNLGSAIIAKLKEPKSVEKT